MSVKARIMEKVKHDHIIRKVYVIIGSTGVNLLKLFIRPDPHLILFNSFGGKKYDDSTKAIYECMKCDARFKEYRLVWAFHEPDKFPEIKDKIKTDGLKYFIYALKARCWISNSSMQRGLLFKGKETFSFNTWHGTPLKCMNLLDTKVNSTMDTCDVILAQSNYEVQAFVNCWHLSSSKYKVLGLPRNDILVRSSAHEKDIMRKRIGIPEDKLVILYAPTFRDYLLDESSRCTLEVPFDYKYWEEILGNRFVFLMRMHYEVAKHNVLPRDERWRDVSNYPSLNELIIASDVLISDYSSIIFDYSILGRPIINYVYDYEEYEKKRGLLFDIRKELPWTTNSRELAEIISEMDYSAYAQLTESFREKYVEEYGNATRKSVDLIYNSISNK